ncbi:SWR1 complex subunit 6-like isoform X1 [Miscanthus floridulus]|uniref:SWR1 complex subunit 6-like isoform X1 n=1 Tax=Miscanthus floridulus TaxID=154761 RepID=UPI00345AC0C5
MDGEEENIGPFRRTSARTRRMATRMASALASSDNRAQAALARLEALESDNAGVEVVDLNDDEYGSTDEEDPVLMQKKQSKIIKRKTRQGQALEKRAARSFMDVTRRLLWVHRALHLDGSTAQSAVVLQTTHA